MEGLNLRLLLHNWQRKLFAIAAGLILWISVHKSITHTRTFGHVPVRIENLSSDHTVMGMDSNNILSETVSLKITGDKEALDLLDEGDLEVVLDVAGQPSHWLASIGVADIRVVDTDADLSNKVIRVVSSPVVVHQSPLVTAQIPVQVLPPLGEAPKGYQFAGVWPTELSHTITAADEEVWALQDEGLTLLLDLSKISKMDLDRIAAAPRTGPADEVSFYVPAEWKQVAIPFLGNRLQAVNDPAATGLRLDFLRRETLQVESSIPILLFFLPKYSATHNPQTLRLATTEAVQNRNGVMTLAMPVYVKNVSRLFLDIISEHIAVVINIDPTTEGLSSYPWSIQIVEHERLEDRYVEQLLPGYYPTKSEELSPRDRYLRQRFRDYMNQLELYSKDQMPLKLLATRQGNLINIQDVTNR